MPRTVSNTYTQVAQAHLCANHVQFIEHLSHASFVLRAMRYEGTAQLLSLTEQKLHLFELYFIGRTITDDLFKVMLIACTAMGHCD